MPENKLYPPEGLHPPVHLTLSDLREALESGAILEAPVQRCDVNHTLCLSLGGVQGYISREEAVVIGDSLSSDIQGAVNAGLRSIWFAPRGEARPEAGYTWRAGNYYEIKRVLRHV